MKLSSILLIIFICLAFSSYAGNGIIHLTDSNYTEIPYTKSEFAPFTNGKATALSKQDIKEIEILMNKCIDEYNKRTKWERIDKIQYMVQLVPILNEKGEIEVWVNCFCGAGFGNWRKEIFEVNDGGSCFFNLKINIGTKKYYDLAVNGLA